MSLPPPPSYASYAPPQAFPPAPAGRPAPVRVARIAGLVALVGGVLNVAAFVAFIVVDTLDYREAFGDYSTGSYVGIVAATLSVVVLTLIAPWGSLLGAAGYSAGRAVVWVVGPFSFLANLIGVAGAISALDDDDVPVPVKAAAALGLVGAVALAVGVTVATVAWILPGARRYLADHRRPGREARGGATLLVAAGLGVLSVVLCAAAIAVLIYAGQHVQAPSWSVVGDDVRAYFAGGMAVAAVTLLFELVVVTGALVARFRRAWWARAVAFAVGLVTLVVGLGGSVFVANLAPIARRNDTGDTTEHAALLTLFVFGAAVLVHVATLLLLAMPSVSARVSAGAPGGPR